jgi:hypothetical protein
MKNETKTCLKRRRTRADGLTSWTGERERE